MNFFARCLILQSLVALSACSTLSSITQGDKVDYRSASQDSSTPKLEVPPDLTSPPENQRYAVPGAGAATALDYQRTAISSTTVASTVLVQPAGVRIERAGTQRWLVVDKSVEQVWPILRQFWQDAGFTMEIDSPATGILETDWAENRAKLPQDIIRRTLGKIVDGLYSTSERDKFRTRIERDPNGGTDIYITHRGMREELVGAQKETTMWVQRPTDPELEAEFLSRLVARFGGEAEKAKQEALVGVTAQPNTKTPKAETSFPSRVRTVNGAPVLALQEPLDRAWRILEIALDHTHFTVDDRDRSQGTYFVRYVSNANAEEKKQGFFSKLFSSSPKIEAKRYQIKLVSAPNGSEVTVHDETGKPEMGTVATDILKLLDEAMH